MNELLAQFSDFIGIDGARAVLRAAFVFVVGIGLAIFLPRRVRHLNLHPQQRLILRSFIRYGLIVVTVIWTLSLLGIDLSVLFGAAGILTVALGFASQASASNLISGLFLMFESHFVVGDIITVGDITGEVTSIDPLSVKVRTFQNLSVRIPNETMLKANVTNLSGYPIRRYDLKLMVGHSEDIAKVTQSSLRQTVGLVPQEPVLFHRSIAALMSSNFSSKFRWFVSTTASRMEKSSTLLVSCERSEARRVTSSNCSNSFCSTLDAPAYEPPGVGR